MAPASGAGLICLAWTRGRVHRSDGPAVRAIPQPEKGMAVTIVEEARPVTGGVDTHDTGSSRTAAAAPRTSPDVDRPGNLGGSDSWEDAGSWRHSGSIRRSCASAR